MLIVFEGIDGCGKSTQAALLAGVLAEQGVAHLLLREPGGTVLGERVRGLLLDAATKACPVAELFGYLLARAQLVVERIRPALAMGTTVILDRYYHSTLAYQAYGLGLPLPQVRSAIDLAVGGLRPDLGFFLRIDPLAALERRQRGRGAGDDRIEARGLDYLRRVAGGYEALVAAGELTALDASAPAEALAAAVRARVLPVLGLRTC